jgi:hypothetical protein
MVNDTAKASELSRLVKISSGLPAEPIVVEADAKERAALAERFALSGIDRLHAEMELEQRGKAIRASGRLQAAIRQVCAISGEDFPANIDEEVDLRFVEQERSHAKTEDGDIEIELDADDCDEIEYSGDSFDLGEAIAQTLGLAIDPYAEGPLADTARKAAGIVAEGEQDGPLAQALKGLKQKG